MLSNINPLMLVMFFVGACFGFVISVFVFAAREINNGINKNHDRD